MKPVGDDRVRRRVCGDEVLCAEGPCRQRATARCGFALHGRLAGQSCGRAVCAAHAVVDAAAPEVVVCLAHARFKKRVGR